MTDIFSQLNQTAQIVYSRFKICPQEKFHRTQIRVAWRPIYVASRTRGGDVQNLATRLPRNRPASPHNALNSPFSAQIRTAISVWEIYVVVNGTEIVHYRRTGRLIRDVTVVPRCREINNRRVVPVSRSNTHTHQLYRVSLCIVLIRMDAKPPSATIVGSTV